MPMSHSVVFSSGQHAVQLFENRANHANNIRQLYTAFFQRWCDFSRFAAGLYVHIQICSYWKYMFCVSVYFRIFYLADHLCSSNGLSTMVGVVRDGARVSTSVPFQPGIVGSTLNVASTASVEFPLWAGRGSRSIISNDFAFPAVPVNIGGC
jgi:hypothetical protein